jgi:hypothetical protein
MPALLRLILIALLLAPGVAPAKIYKWILPDGSIKYSDKPQEQGAQELQLPPLQTYSAPPLPSSGEGAEQGSGPVAESGYDVVEVVTPEQGQSIRDNGGTIDVRLVIEPGLRSGHVVEIMLDGNAIGSGRATSASVSNLDRGTHTISATVKDASGKVVASAGSVTFHLLRTSKLQPGRAGNRPARPRPR